MVTNEISKKVLFLIILSINIFLLACNNSKGFRVNQNTGAPGTGSLPNVSSNTNTAEVPISAPNGPPVPTESSQSNLINVYCVSSLQSGGSATCSTVLIGTYKSGGWYVNGTPYSQCDNQPSCTWTSIPTEIYRVQAYAVDTQNRIFASNLFTVSVVDVSEVQAKAVSISCNLTLRAGQSASCSATLSKNVVSGAWYVNGSRYSDCDNKGSCTWSNIAQGIYQVRAIVQDSSGNSVESNQQSVYVYPTQ